MYCTWDTTEDVIYEWSQGIIDGMEETPIEFDYSALYGLLSTITMIGYVVICPALDWLHRKGSILKYKNSKANTFKLKGRPNTHGRPFIITFYTYM